MTLSITSKIPFLRAIRRKSLHRQYVYKRMLETRNRAVRLLLSIDLLSEVEIQQKAKKRKGDSEPYFICRIAQEDLNLLLQAKEKIQLTRKYRRRLKLLDY